MKRVNIKDAFVGEPASSQEGVEADDSDEAIVLAVRGGELVIVPSGTPEESAVGEIMTSEVVSVAEATSIEQIAALMAKKQIKRVPVDRDGTLIGMVSRADIVCALAARA